MNNKVLLVDDDPYVLQAYTRTLRGSFSIKTAKSGTEGLEILKEEGPYAVVVSDYLMPKMDGVQFLAQTKELYPDTVRIMLSGQADLDASIQAVNEGNIFRFLNKPCSPHHFIKTLNAAIEQYSLVIAERELLEKTLKGSIKLLLEVNNALDSRAFRHIKRLRILAGAMAKRLKIDNRWEAEIAVMLSQVGCIVVPQEIEKKQLANEPLTDEEKEIFFSHAQFGKSLLMNIPRLESIAEGVYYQFKQYDGRGFPNDSKKGKEIPLLGRILKVLLDFNALLESGMAPFKATDEMIQRKGYYDPDIIAALNAELHKTAKGYVVTPVMISDLVYGMILADDITDNNGSVLVRQGQEITEVLQLRLLVFSRLGRVTEPVKVLKPI
ncbi:response regulator [Dehalobacter sp. DCM]|uniref:HD domain-containing phosphohydrolase n=1 Tax=Dehalobacter sp. DCM TaxID=2907827 RepID=UPI003081599A|nr:response regulator [Dehalobacter sp. DCM]